ncbi:MAG: GNAT family N-acetyltransferase [Paracoccaceae bacterium]
MIERAETPEALARCLALRTEVFVAEQGVSALDEQDGRDVEATHWIATLGARTLATARVLRTGPAAKVQRVAVARPARGTGLGATMMRTVIDAMRAEPGVERLVLDSQLSALGFYEKLGFVAEGETFLDAGIEHKRMTLAL